MIAFTKKILNNGLTVIAHEDFSTPLAAVNILYKVGSRNETEDQTGFAHLFEHLMFGGSASIPVFDSPLQMAGGENNAFTSTDITNYYETLPAANVETALWLESDRMNQLAFSEQSLEVQRKVVVEEFKEHYINQPYGNVWHKLRALAYTTHPYKWPTIGLIPEHIQDAQLQNVKDFFYRWYRPNNAVLVIGGPLKSEAIFALAEKWFGDIPSNTHSNGSIVTEPPQTAPRTLTVEEDVPFDALYKAWHFPARLDEKYYASDLLSDILAGGKSARLYQVLVKEKKLFAEINCYQTGCVDPGLIVVDGKLVKGIKMETAEAAVMVEIEKLQSELLNDTELQKIKNRVESQNVFAETEVLHRAMGLAYCEMLGNANLVNEETANYAKVTAQQIQQQARSIFRNENCSTLYYLARGTHH